MVIMKSFSYKTQGTCARTINFDIDQNKVHNEVFGGGSNGNTQGVSRLVEGMEVDKVISLLSGVNCNGRGTSCPDQLAKALAEAKKEQ